MNTTEYRGSKKRLFILLTGFAVQLYNLSTGDRETVLLSLFVAPLIGLGMFDYWRNIR